MQSLKSLMLVGAAALAFMPGARAADWPGSQPPAPSEKGPLLVQEFASGWYIRGDVGYRFNSTSGGSAFGTPFDSTSFANTPAYGGGFGVKYGWFRTDITFDFMQPTQFTGSTAAISPLVQNEITAYTGLINGYVDLGTWWGMTPYIGAGIGASFVRTGDLTAVFPGPDQVVIGHPGVVDFAWAAMLGFAYPIYPNLQVDVGYRYLHVGSARTDVDPFGPVTYGNLNANEIRVGLRYQLD